MGLFDEARSKTRQREEVIDDVPTALEIDSPGTTPWPPPFTRGGKRRGLFHGGATKWDEGCCAMNATFHRPTTTPPNAGEDKRTLHGPIA